MCFFLLCDNEGAAFARSTVCEFLYAMAPVLCFICSKVCGSFVCNFLFVTSYACSYYVSAIRYLFILGAIRNLFFVCDKVCVFLCIW